MTRAGPIRAAGRDAGAGAGVRGNPHRRLLRALVAMAGGIERAEIAEACWEPWASATFQGMRHLTRLRIAGADAEARSAALARALPEAEFHVPGHIVADVSVDGRTRCDASGDWLLSLSALTIEDW